MFRPDPIYCDELNFRWTHRLRLTNHPFEILVYTSGDGDIIKGRDSNGKAIPYSLIGNRVDIGGIQEDGTFWIRNNAGQKVKSGFKVTEHVKNNK